MAVEWITNDMSDAATPGVTLEMEDIDIGKNSAKAETIAPRPIAPAARRLKKAISA